MGQLIAPRTGPEERGALGAKVAGLARDWLGTPYVHQASLKAAGSDCLGLIRGIWRDIYGQEPEVPPAYSFDWGETDGRELLLEAASRWLVAKPCALLALGDVLLFRMRQDAPAKHLGIVSGIGFGASTGSGTGFGVSPMFIHAYSGHGVVENSLSLPWLRRIAAVYHFPEE